ncbi:hypothetical protein ACFR9U_17200 [Halorientalis brevis]|uniref:Uncharacterized protein n=1 Tax=Halorientalis brevis TaxID=1126241 RepID=A0ABD6CEU9_9EURY|nr:hypothetical protein [Halorientalis brevis]
MTANFTGGGSSGPDYVQTSAPADPDETELWYDPSADPDGDGTNEGEYYIFGTDGQWHPTGVESHTALVDVAEDSHHAFPIRTSGLTDDAVTQAKIAAGAVSSTQLADAAVTLAKLGFDPATQTELNDHASSANAHHTPPTETLDNAGTPEVWMVGDRVNHPPIYVESWDLYNQNESGNYTVFMSDQSDRSGTIDAGETISMDLNGYVTGLSAGEWPYLKVQNPMIPRVTF